MANAETTENNDLTVTVEQPKAWARRMKITVPAVRLDQQRREVTQRLAGRVRLPGFRKGKVPAHVLEKQFGASIDQEALQKVIGDAYKEALAREGLEPITQGAVSNLEYERGTDVRFDVDFEVRPQIELERVGGFEVTREKRAVGDAQVQQVLDRLQEEHAVWNAVEDESPVMGDMVSVDITPYDEEGVLKIGAMRPYQIILGKEEARPEVEQAILTLNPGEDADFAIAHVEKAGEEHHGEHEHRARVRLKEVKRPQLPALDDDLARSVGDFETLDQLQARVRTDLEREAEQDAENDVRRQILEHILEANSFEVPDAMLEQYLERILPAREGSSPERIAEARQGMRPAAERAIKRMLVIERVAEMEGLQATASEIQERLEQVAARVGRPLGDVRKRLQKDGQLDALQEEITEEKVFAYLKSLSTVK